MEALSYSSLTQFNECPFRFIKERIEMVPVEQLHTPATARGTIIHKFMEDMINFHIQNGKWLDEDQARVLMAYHWDTEDALNGKEVQWPDGYKEQSKKYSIDLIPQIYKEVLPLLNPLAAEQMLEMDLPVPGNTVKRLRGIVDCVSEPNTIIDWKTSTTSRNPAQMRYDLQSTTYTALTGLEKAQVLFVQFIYQVRGAKIEILPVRRDRRHVDWLLNKYIPAIIKQIESGDELPPTPGYHCGSCQIDCGISPK